MSGVHPLCPAACGTTIIPSCVRSFGKKLVLRVAFERAKQPQQIKDVLSLVYVNKDQLDADLVTSIVNPALDPQASEVFFLVRVLLRFPFQG